MKTLAQILPQVCPDLIADDCAISAVRDDSRLVETGDIFFAIAINLTLRDQHIHTALENGAQYIFYDAKDVCEIHDPRIIAVDNVRHLLGEAAHRFYGCPSESIPVVAVTGTNGKTSVCHIAAQLAACQQKKVAVLGTAGNGIWPDLKQSELTTLGVVQLHQQLAHFVKHDVDIVFMETSSHALAQQRCAGLRLAAAGFTNLSRDHLDYHGTMQEYARQKRKLFDLPIEKVAILNADEAIVQQWLKTWPISKPRKLISAVDNSCDYYLRSNVSQRLPQTFVVVSHGHDYAAKTPLVGRFNVMNILMAFALLSELDFSQQKLIDDCQLLLPVCGRMQLLQKVGFANIVIDYCHTPDALEKALQALREFCAEGMLYCVFGCGGDRDRGKRAQMAQIAEKNADKLIITNDNPRTESPQAIVNDICAGLSRKKNPAIELDRKKAIKLAIDQAAEGDVVLIAGKGHEDYQIMGKEKQPFSDKRVVLDCFSKG